MGDIPSCGHHGENHMKNPSFCGKTHPHAWWAQNLLDDLGSAQNLGSDVLGASIGPSPATDVELSRCPGDSPNRRADQESAGALAGEDDCCWIILLILLVRFTQGIFGNDAFHHIRNVIIPATPSNPSSNPTQNAPVKWNSPCIDGLTTGLHDIAPGGWVLQETRAGFSRGREAGRGWLWLWLAKNQDPYPLFSPNFSLKHGETQKNIGLQRALSQSKSNITMISTKKAFVYEPMVWDGLKIGFKFDYWSTSKNVIYIYTHRINVRFYIVWCAPDIKDVWSGLIPSLIDHTGLVSRWPHAREVDFLYLKLLETMDNGNLLVVL